MGSHPGQAREPRTANADPEVRAVTQTVGTGMPRMCGAFVQHLQLGGRQRGFQCSVQRLCRWYGRCTAA